MSFNALIAHPPKPRPSQRSLCLWGSNEETRSIIVLFNDIPFFFGGTNSGWLLDILGQETEGGFRFFVIIFYLNVLLKDPVRHCGVCGGAWLRCQRAIFS